MKFVIESDGVLLGPFNSAAEAAMWAVEFRATPWTLRSIHIIPPQDAGDD